MCCLAFSLCYAGGTLKIYGHTICRELPYKTLLLSVTDDAFNIVKETLVKYKLEKENPNDYCLVKASDSVLLFEDYLLTVCALIELQLKF